MSELYGVLVRKTYYISKILFLFLCVYISQTEAKIWVFDINDTITVENRIDPRKGFNQNVVIGQLIAQNLILIGEGNVKEKNYKGKSVEDYIKGFFPAKKVVEGDGRETEDKTEQRNKYEEINNYAAELVHQNLLPATTTNDITTLRALIEPTLNTVKESGGFFPSFFKIVDKILKEDPEPIFLIQSFGLEIAKLLKALGKRYKNLAIEQDIGVFQEDGSLKFGTFKDGKIELEANGKTIKVGVKAVKGSENMRALLAKPFHVYAWRNNYDGWMAERFKQRMGGIEGKNSDWTGGKILFYPEAKFYDDNADVCSWVWKDGQFMPLRDGYENGVKESYITKVDTLQALIDEDYFVNSAPFVKFLNEKAIEKDTAINAVKRYTTLLEQALVAGDQNNITHYSNALAQLVVTGNVTASQKPQYGGQALQPIVARNYKMSTRRKADEEEKDILRNALHALASVQALGYRSFDMEGLVKTAPNQAHAKAALKIYQEQGLQQVNSPLVLMSKVAVSKPVPYQESPYAGAINYKSAKAATTSSIMPYPVRKLYSWIQTIYGTDDELERLYPHKFGTFLGVTLRRPEPSTILSILRGQK